MKNRKQGIIINNPARIISIDRSTGVEFIVYVPVPIEISESDITLVSTHPVHRRKCAISRAGCPLSMSSHDLSRLYTRTPRHSAGKLFQFVLVSLIGHREFAHLLILFRTYFFSPFLSFFLLPSRRKYRGMHPRNCEWINRSIMKYASVEDLSRKYG